MITFTNNYAGAEPARRPQRTRVLDQATASGPAPPTITPEAPQEAPSALAQAMAQQKPAFLNGGDVPYQSLVPGHMGGLANPDGNAYGLNYGQTFMGQQPQRMPPVSAPQGPAVYNAANPWSDGLLGNQSEGPAMPPPQPQSMSPFFNMRRGFRFNRP